MQIDIDKDLAKTPISNREKIAIYILLLIFRFILPAQYAHQMDKIYADLKQWM